MTHTIPVGSPKAARAAAFGRELARAMAARGVGRRTLADAIGAGDSSIQYYRAGKILPRHEMAIRLAESLSWPRLVDLSIDARRKACLVDGREFIDESGSDNQRYCSPECQRVAEKQRIGRPATRIVAAGHERRAKRLQVAIDAMCRACEPEGVCRTADCPLRRVSPLRLAGSTPEPMVAESRLGNAHSPAARAKRSVAGAATWAGYTPEQRAERIATTTAARHGARA